MALLPFPRPGKVWLRAISSAEQAAIVVVFCGRTLWSWPVVLFVAAAGWAFLGIFVSVVAMGTPTFVEIERLKWLLLFANAYLAIKADHHIWTSEELNNWKQRTAVIVLLFLPICVLTIWGITLLDSKKPEDSHLTQRELLAKIPRGGMSAPVYEGKESKRKGQDVNKLDEGSKHSAIANSGVNFTPFSERVEHLVLFLGSNAIGGPQISLKGDWVIDLQRVSPLFPNFKLESTKGVFSVSGIFHYDSVGGAEATIVRNEFMNVRSDFDRNYSASAFEIVNQQYKPVLQIITDRSAGTVKVYGVFRWGDHGQYVQVADSNGFVQFDLREGERNLYTLASKSIFKYPSWRHLGEYAE